ncbi:hypothetical protein [Limnobacter parvus]|uniref:Uncharacterized protein n=1 Tax=Limnobacter parvus TaxID=2939690 RepID=A0ABT1XKQ5_9BURK|nr:hypothetical protein [Limnobacter parvus]MCR2747877.1 hypothetical protein [Limnobacter parvus]
MKDVENLFKRLGTKSDYQDFGSKVLDDVRQKWPLLDDVSTAEKLRKPSNISTSIENITAKAEPAPALPMSEVARPQGAEQESRLPVRAFVSRKAPVQESVREIFKSIGKSQRLTPAKESDPAAKPKTLFDGTQLNSGKKT